MEQKEDNKENKDLKPDDEQETDKLEGESLDNSATETDSPSDSTEVISNSTEEVTDTTHGVEIKKKKRPLKGISKITAVNIYLLIFILMIIIASLLSFVLYQQSKKEDNKTKESATETLSQETLDQLKQTDVRVGDPKQILSVESNAIFSGNVLIKDSLEVAGRLKIGGSLELPNVSGASSFDQVSIKNLDVSGNTNIQGQLSIQQALTVGGNLSVRGSLSAGQLTLDGLQVNGTLQISQHIDAAGPTPGRSNGSSLGAGGTTSVSGTDTAGTVNINTGSGAGNGCFVTVTFSRQFDGTPHVVISPVGKDSGSINYYVSRSTSNFSICAAGSVGGGKNLAYDYIVID